MFHEDLLLGELKGKGSMATWGDFKEEYQAAVFTAGVEGAAFLAIQAIQAAVVFQVEEDFQDLGEAAFLEVEASLAIQAIQAAVVFQMEEDLGAGGFPGGGGFPGPPGGGDPGVPYAGVPAWLGGLMAQQESVRAVDLPALPELSESEIGPLIAGDWLTTVGPFLRDMSSSSSMWWDEVLNVAGALYRVWLNSEPMERLRLVPVAPPAAMASH